MSEILKRHTLAELGRQEQNLYRSAAALDDDSPHESYIDNAERLFHILTQELQLIVGDETEDTVSEKELNVIKQRIKQLSELRGHLNNMYAAHQQDN